MIQFEVEFRNGAGLTKKLTLSKCGKDGTTFTLTKQEICLPYSGASNDTVFIRGKATDDTWGNWV